MTDCGEHARCVLALEDGTIFFGGCFGAEGTQTGEVVFNTSMTGYQEVLTDPSYCGQIVTMTSPQIGSYGVNIEDAESSRPHVPGFIVKELARRHSNYRATLSLDEYLAQHTLSKTVRRCVGRPNTSLVAENKCRRGQQQKAHICRSPLRNRGDALRSALRKLRRLPAPGPYERKFGPIVAVDVVVAVEVAGSAPGGECAAGTGEANLELGEVGEIDVSVAVEVARHAIA